MPESLFLIKLQAEACNFIKKETLAHVFSCEFCEISKNTSGRLFLICVFFATCQSNTDNIRL